MPTTEGEMTYKDSYQQAQILLEREEGLVDEAKSCYGMLNEAVSKALLLQNNIETEKVQQIANGEDLEPSEDVVERMKSLKADFHRYSQRFDEISEELRVIYDELENFSKLGAD